MKPPKPNREHARLKLIITFGIVSSSTVQVIAPAYVAHATVLGIVINLIWIWF